MLFVWGGKQPKFRNLVFAVMAALTLATSVWRAAMPMPAIAVTNINTQISFQGKLVNTNGTNIADNTYNVEFKLYTGGAGTAVGDPGGTLQWTEDRLIGGTGGVTTTSGTFQVNLGSVTSLPTNIWNNNTIWLSIQLGNTSSCTITTTFTSNCGGDTEMVPMVRLTASPYAYNSDLLDGIDSTGYVQLGQSASAQTDGSTNSSIFINKTASGNLLQLQASGTDAFSLTNAGDLTFGQNANHTISVTTIASNAAGRTLTVSAGAGGAGASANAGGVLTLQGGAGGGTNGAGGDVTINGGAKNGSGANGNINVGTTTAAAITLGNGTDNTNVSIQGSGTFGTNTGTTSLNGTTQIAANKNLSLLAGTGTVTQNYNAATADAFSILATSATLSTARLAVIDHTASYSTNVTDSGNGLRVNRALTSTANTLTLSGALATLSSNCTVAGGACTDSSKLLSLTQSYASASGDLLTLSNSGTGKDISGTSNTWNISKTGAFVGVGVNSGSGQIQGTGGLSVTGTITFGSLTASRALFTDGSSNVVATGASAALLNALTDETGTGVAVFGTSPAITTSLTTGSASFDLLNATATTINFGGGATTALNIGAATGTNNLQGNTVVAANKNLTFTAGTGTVTQNYNAATADAFSILATSATLSTARLAVIDHTASYSTNVTDSGNGLRVNRALTSTANTLTLSGALATLSSNCTVAGGACTDSAKLLSLTQSYASASGDLLTLSNSGTGKDISGTSNTWNISKTGAFVGVGVNSGSGQIQGTGGLSVTGTITFGSLTASRALFTDGSSNVVATGASAALLNALTDETGTGVAVFGTSPAITTSLTTGSASFDLLNTTATTINFGGGATTALNIGAATGTNNLQGNTVVAANKNLTFTAGTGTVTQNYNAATADAFSILATSATLSTARLAVIDHTATYVTSVTDSGNNLRVNRSLTTNTGGALTLNGALATLSSNCTVTAGTCTDSSNLLSLTQSYASASGAVIAISNSGSGNDVQGSSSTWTISKTGVITSSGSELLSAANALTLGTASSASGGILFKGQGGGTVTFQAPTTAITDYTLKLPTAQASGTQVLQNDGSGNLSWVNASGGGSTLQTAYANSTGGTTPEILADSTRVAVDIQDANTTLGANKDLLTVHASTSGALGDAILAVNTGSEVNKITNASFESNTTGWAAKNGGAVAADTNGGSVYGNNALHTTTVSSAGDGAKYTYAPPSNTTYTFSAYIKGGSSFSLNMGHHSTIDNDTCVISVTTSWQHFSCTMALTTADTYVYVDQLTAAVRNFYIDGAQLEISSVDTAYSPGGIDLNGAILSPVNFQNRSDNNTAFQIQNAAASTTLLSADTLNSVLNLSAPTVNVNPAAASTTAFQVQNVNAENTLGVDTTSTTNVLTNTSFETNTNGWAAKNGGAVASDNSGGSLFGNKALHVTTVASTLDGAKYTFTPGSNATYTFSFYAKSQSSTFNLTMGHHNSVDADVCTISITTTWQRYTCTMALTTADTYVYVDQPVASIHNFFLDGAQLEVGSVATAYAVGKIDLDGAISNPVFFQNRADTTDAFQIQNAAATTTLLSADTLNKILALSAPTVNIGPVGTGSATALQVQNINAENLIAADTTTATNVITNSSFETSTTGWAAKNGGAVAFDNVGGSQFGSNALHTTTVASAADGAKYTYAPPSNATYTFSFYLRTGSSNFSLNIGHHTTVDTDTCTISAVTTWARYSCTMALTTADTYIYVDQLTGSVRNWYIDGAQLELGSTMTGYAPGVIDLDGIIASPTTFQNRADSTNAFAIQSASGGTVLNVDTVNGRVGIATTNPTFGFAYNSAIKVLGIAGDGSASASSFGLIALGNNRATTTVGDTAGELDFLSLNNAGNHALAGINTIVSGAGGANGFGGDITFATKGDNSTTVSERLRVSNAGNVGIGTAGNTPAELLSLGWAGTTKGVISFSGNTSGKITIQPQAAAGTYTLTLPNAQASGIQFLQNDGSGNLSWASSSCGTCIIQLPTTTAQNTINPGANNAVALTVRGSSNGATPDIVDFLASGGSTVGFINAAGNFNIGSTAAGAPLSVTKTVASGSGGTFDITQNAVNTSDVGDMALKAYDTISVSSATSQLVTRGIQVAVTNNLTGGGAVTNLRVLEVVGATNTSTTTTSLDNVFIGAGTSNGTVTSSRGVVVSSMQGTSQAAFVSNTLGGTNNTLALLGTTTIPSGTFGIYQASPAGVNNYISGNLGINNTAPTTTKLLVTNTGTSPYTQTGISLQSTFTPSAGGTQNNFTSTVTNTPTSSANTAVGLSLTVNDATTLANTLQGINLALSDTGSGAKTVRGLFVDTSGTTNTSASVTTALFKSASSTTAFQVQNASAAQLFNVDTTNNVITLNGNNSGEISGWTTNGNALTQARWFGASASANGYAYQFGGINTSGTTQSTSYYAKLNADGSVGAWNTTTAMTVAMQKFTAVTANGYVYLLGGENGSGANNTVYYAKINADGTLGSWNTTSVLPAGRFNGASTVANGYVYYIGGQDESTGSFTSVWYAKLNADGTLGTWNSGSTGIPAAKTELNSSAQVANGFIYLVGGYTGSAFTNTTYYAQLNPAGGIQNSGACTPWCTASNNLPDTLGDETTVVANGYLYSIAGYDNTVISAVYYTSLNADGSIGAWSTSTHPVTAVRRNHNTIVANGYVYVIAGSSDGTSANAQSTVYYTSTERLKFGGALDLVGLGGEDLANGETGTGGSLTAGNTDIVGSLQVQGPTSLVGSLSVQANATFQNHNDSTSAFTIQSAAGSIVLAVDTTNQRIGIGTAPSYKLDVLGNSTAASGTTVIANFTGTQSVANTGFFVGLESQPKYSATSGNTLANLWGAFVEPQNTSTGTVTTATSVLASVKNASTGTITTAYGAYLQPNNASTGTITTAYGAYIQAANATGGTIGTNYGVYIDSPSNSGTITTKYALVTGASAGNVGLGTITPAEQLEVNGNIRLSATGNISTTSGDLKIESASTGNIVLGTSDTTGQQLVLDTKTGSGDPTGVNGAIYFSTGGQGGAQGASSLAGKLRCFEGGLWKNCIGTRDIAERRWGYAVPASTNATLWLDAGLASTVLKGEASGKGGAITSSNQAESNYINYATSATSGNDNGWGTGTFTATLTQTRWLPKIVTRVRVDSTAVTSVRYWIGLSTVAESGSDATGSLIGLRFSTGAGDGSWTCVARDGTTTNTAATGVTVTAGHYYDVIIDLSTSGNLICSVADNGGAYTSSTVITSNLPTTSTSLGWNESVTTLTTAARNLGVAYNYLEFQ